METQKTHQILQEKVAQYQAEVNAQKPTLSEKRLQAYKRLMANRKAVFETTDTENRLGLLPYTSNFALILDWRHRENRTATREEFVEGIKDRLTNKEITNPEVIAEYESYLKEDKNTPYTNSPLSERLSQKKEAFLEYLFPWRYHRLSKK